VHRLLAIAYIPTEDITLTVNHINSCRLNAYLNNLEWATYGENLKHAYQKGAKHSTTKHKAAVSLVGKSRRKTVVQIDIITGKIIAEYVSITEAAKHVGICISNISECCRGKRETAGGYKWKYKNEGEMSICLENFLC
jgi:hypothetical protein